MNSAAPARAVEQITQFRDQDPGWGAGVAKVEDPTRNVGLTTNTDLGSFLQRPVNIFTTNWIESTDGIDTMVIDPWYLFMSHPSISNKLESYKLFRGNMKVKCTLNANGFSYGCMLVYYHPLFYQDTTAGYIAPTNMPAVSPVSASNYKYATMPLSNAAIVRHSQKPHIYLIPSTSTGGTLNLPFLWRENWMDLTTGDVDKLGKIVLHPLNDLKSLDVGVGARVTITIYAWLEDVKLSLATTSDLKLTIKRPSDLVYKPSDTWPNSSPEFAASGDQPETKVKRRSVAHAGDEYGNGPISKVANSIAIGADALSDVPTIGPFARASSLVAQGVGRLASLFGYSRPTILTNVAPYKPMYLGNLANTDAGDSSQKLTLDSKQEVTIDPRVVGLPSQDEMSIRSIAGRESYWRTFMWGGATGSTGNTFNAGDRIMNCVVTPMLYRNELNNTNANTIRCNMTATCFATIPFNNWRGTMRFRFQIIASQFHRGRLRVVWDPDKIKEDAFMRQMDTSVVMSAVVDLADCRDFIVDIGWGRTTTYMAKTIEPQNLNINDNDLFVESSGSNNTVSNETLDSQWGNGVIGLYVVNELIATHTSAGSTVLAPAYVNMFVSCPDLDVANPVEKSLQNWTPVTPSGMPAQLPSELTPPVAHAHAGFEEVQPDHAPVSSGVQIKLGPDIPALDSQISSVFYGDPILSLRTLMKRYTYYMAYYVSHAYGTSDDKAVTLSEYRLPDFPIYFGTTLSLEAPMYSFPAATTTGSALFGFNPCKQSYMSFYAPAYACRRGGMRWKYMFKTRHTAPTAGTSRDTAPLLTITRGAYPTPAYTQSLMENPTGKHFEIPFEYARYMPVGEGGSFVTNTDGNPVAEIELPFYTPYRFLTPKPERESQDTLVVKDRSLSSARDDGEFHIVTAFVAPDKDQGGPLMSYYAAADDFSLHMYLGPPLLYYIHNFDSLKQAHATPFSYPVQIQSQP